MFAVNKRLAPKDSPCKRGARRKTGYVTELKSLAVTYQQLIRDDADDE
jgi:hypothetical protein